jgi:hypothetical protein
MATPPATACLAVDGPVAMDRMLRTGHGDRAANMLAFAAAALQLLDAALDAAPPVAVAGSEGTRGA